MFHSHVRRVWQRISISIIAAAVLAATILTLSMYPLQAEASTLDQMQKQMQALQKEEQAIQKKLSGAKNDLSQQQQYSDSLKEQVKNTQAQIELVQQQIDLLDSGLAVREKDIHAKEAAIADAQTQMEDTFQQLRMRLRALSKTGQLTLLQSVLEADDYVGMLTQTNSISRMAKSDQALIKDIEAQIQKLNADKATLETEQQGLAEARTQVAALRAQNNTKKAALEAQYAESRALEATLERQQKNLAAELAQTHKELDDLEDAIKKAIQDAIKQAAPTETYKAGSMFWPVPTIHVISSGFGPRWGRMHRGIDIANGHAYGESIVAAADGTVIFANKTNSWGSGFGYYLIINHGPDSQGRQISTLYAHASKILVSVGDTVKGGETVIAKIGNTGDSKGAHLHFEVRLDGEAVNPVSNGYVKP